MWNYKNLFKKLLPQGWAWPREKETNIDKLAAGLTIEFDRIQERVNQLIEESDPRTTLELFEIWEKSYGLPDNCVASSGTLQERRNFLLYKITSTGGQSIAYFKSVALIIGYNIDITEYKPFICGISQCGYYLTGGHETRFYWKVTVNEPRLTYFRTGESRIGENLLSVERALDLECLLNKLKPSHTELIFEYTGV